ncbi:pleckstrin homology domain-containing family J member 1-like [Saccoglossus kowalevskii]|uniref:Pleckstrin homology domain-containing family J member 1 n=1 Tax=Saccoglossus kowalevskii TaxID=10224 RepID=A0ABM0MHL2_SACKO|nr:PREDICTED: pleckstrin homology domain-containing family J member 1-like [Saccoglossus kowalevskii]
MRYNEKELIRLAYQPPEIEGRLLHKQPGSKLREGYRERWCRLRGNFLFYFKTNELGKCNRLEPIGALLMERCRVQHEPRADKPFVFSVAYQDGKHYFVGASDQHCELWVKALRQASFESLRARFLLLQAKLKKLTGSDPLQCEEIQKIQKKHMEREKLLGADS